MWSTLEAGDFNELEDEPCLSTFLWQLDLPSLATVGIVLKISLNEPPFIFSLQTKKVHFQNTTKLFNGLFDFHKWVLIVLKASKSDWTLGNIRVEKIISAPFRPVRL